MGDFKIDADLHSALREVRESIRVLFEQLRLRNENGDVSGKERLERVPALAKRNFGNLTGDHIGRAVAEAWRLVDFLEGASAGQLSPLAREGLRVVELDAQMARLRASEPWKDAARRLRQAMDASVTMPESTGAKAIAINGPAPRSGDAAADDQRAGGRVDNPVVAPFAVPEPSGGSRKARYWPGLLIGLTAAGAGALTLALWPSERPHDPRTACLPLERASESDRAAHWQIARLDPVPLPEPDPARPAPVILTISDPEDGPVSSIFTTSQFSFETHAVESGATPDPAGTAGPGGGRADERLRVGGWGDTYLSLLKLPVPNGRLARRATLRLTILNVHDPDSRRTTMALRLITEPWVVARGPQERLWWRSCPHSQNVMRLPEPSEAGNVYDTNITDIYNLWAQGRVPNHGLMLEPENIGSYGSSREHFSNFNTFYSTRAPDPEKRPKLILTY